METSGLGGVLPNDVQVGNASEIQERLTSMAAEVCAAITLIFRDYGRRESRAKARLAFLIDVERSLGSCREEATKCLFRGRGQGLANLDGIQAALGAVHCIQEGLAA